MTFNELTQDEWLQIAGIGLCLVLVLSALSSRGLRMGFVLRTLIGWLLIGSVIFIAFANRGEVAGVLAQVTDRLGIGNQVVEGQTVRIAMSPDGHFWARATINGVPRRMLIDSGATITAISARSAEAAGIDVSESALPVLIGTANGTVEAKRATVKHLNLGSLGTSDLPVVVAPNFGDFDVLGMNFLSRLGSWRVEGETLILEPKKPSKDADMDLT